MKIHNSGNRRKQIFSQKISSGAYRDGHWVFGGIERNSKKCFLVEVPDRTAETLLPIILEKILPGSTIMSDAWRSYGTLNHIGGGIYNHRVVVHQDNFVDPEYPDVHTQNVENMWMRAKRKLRKQFGTSHVLFHSYLSEFMWGNTFPKATLFAQFIVAVNEIYPV